MPPCATRAAYNAVGNPAASHQFRNCSLNALPPYGLPVAVTMNVKCSLGVASSTVRNSDAPGSPA